MLLSTFPSFYSTYLVPQNFPEGEQFHSCFVPSSLFHASVFSDSGPIAIPWVLENKAGEYLLFARRSVSNF